MIKITEKYLSEIDADIAERKDVIKKFNDEILELENLRKKITMGIGSVCSISKPIQMELAEIQRPFLSPQAERQRRVRVANALKVDEYLRQNNGVASTGAIAKMIGLSRMATLKLLKTENFPSLSKGTWGARNKN